MCSNKTIVVSSLFVNDLYILTFQCVLCVLALHLCAQLSLRCQSGMRRSVRVSYNQVKANAVECIRILVQPF